MLLSFSVRASIAAAVVMLALATQLNADTFRFKDGRVIVGKVRNVQTETIGQVPTTVWSVEIEEGVFIQILESNLANNGYEKLDEKRQAYLENVGGKQQTMDYHLALASECSKNHFTDLARAHFLRVLDFDPNYSPARSATGYTQDPNGRWIKKDVLMGEQRGKVFVGGKWMYPEMVAIEKNKEETRQKIGAATRDLHRWHNIAMTAKGGRLEEALRGIQQINDPLATGKLVELLLESRKPAPPSLRLIYVQLLSQFHNFEAANALARASIIDPQPEIRTACLNSLSRFGREAAIPIYIGYLFDKDNAKINAAADALGQLRAESAVLPLISALVTTHKFETGNGAGINASPTSGSFSTGKQAPVEMDIQNQSVFATLSALTGQASLGFDENRWIAWYASVHAPSVNDPRRDL